MRVFLVRHGTSVAHETGKIEGFEVDENRIVNLSDVVHVYDIIPWGAP